MDEIYVKAFVAFIIGALVYNLIDSMKLCNKNIVEGQGAGTCILNENAVKAIDDVTAETCADITVLESCNNWRESDSCKWEPAGYAPGQTDGQKYGPLGTNSLNNIMDDINKSLEV